SHIVSLTHSGVQELESILKRNNHNPEIIRNKTTVIPCAADLDFFNRKNVHPNDLSHHRQKLGITDTDIILGYHGSLATWYLPSEMVDAFANLRKTEPSLRFLVVSHDNTVPLLHR